jgi:hypothetical protein
VNWKRKENSIIPQTKKLRQFSIQFIFFRAGRETIFFFFSAGFEDMWVALIWHKEKVDDAHTDTRHLIVLGLSATNKQSLLILRRVKNTKKSHLFCLKQWINSNFFFILAASFFIFT